MKDVIIIGAGPAGMTSAIYACSAGMSVILLERAMYGGQMTSTAEIDNYPGCQRVSGWQLSQNMFEQVSSSGIDITYDNAVSIRDMGTYKKEVGEKAEYDAYTVIIANGVKRRMLGCPGEQEFAGRGVSYCAVCDGAFFRGKDVVVVGGGNTALEDAVYLSGICSKVWLVHRRDEFRAEEKYVKDALAKENIIPLYSSVVKGIFGNASVNKVEIENLTDSTVKEIPVSGVFAAIGLIPDNERFSDIVETVDGGYILSGESCRTSCEGIYTAGDTRNKALRQIVTATSDGAAAARCAVEYVRRADRNG